MFEKLYNMQAQQQRDLGADPEHLTDAERETNTRGQLLGIYEETAELQRLTTTYKRHKLRQPEANRENIADEVADILKHLFSTAQLHDLTPQEIEAAFTRKTKVTYAKMRYDRFKLRAEDRVVMVDIDDVTADLSHWQAKLVKLKSGLPTGEASLRVMEDFKDRFYRSGGFRDLDPIPGAKAGLKRLADAGFKIILATARPADQYKRVYSDTLTWLEAHRIPHDKLIFNKDKVEAIHENVTPAWPVAFIEDHPKNALSLAAAGVNVLLFNQPYNANIENVDNITRVRSWGEAVDIITRPPKEDTDQQAEYASSLKG